MADLDSSPVKVTLEQTYNLAADNVDLIRRLGRNVNWILDNIAELPVGSITTAQLTESQFQAVRGTDWVLCDGQPASGSVYQILTGNGNVPDLRATYLRGKNNGRNDGLQNPDGDLALGTVQQSQASGHNHPTQFNHNIAFGLNVNDQFWNFAGPQFASENTGFARTLTFDISGPNGTTAPTTSDTVSGQNESRPRSTIENFFIRIN